MKKFFSWNLALILSSLASANIASAHPTQQYPQPTYGRCNFPSSRVLSSLISQDLKGIYQKAGYTSFGVYVQVLRQRVTTSPISYKNIYGFQAVVPNPANPTNVEIKANAGGVPIVAPCTLEATIQTKVYLTAPDGKKTSGTSTSTVVMEGAFY